MIQQNTEPQVCAWNGDDKKNEPGCDVLIIEKKTYNQKYCCQEHCRKATNKNIMLDYYARRDRQRGKKRECTSCGGTLSRYNETEICSLCAATNAKNRNDSARRLFADILVT